ncbi:hypothetical protein [Pseudomonas sp. nanlin1]|uniref:hypothetical protein n=1 Tax=Pseudomonas sp. nanlin1 TaxID=3040605 RepID=UPI00388F4062
MKLSFAAACAALTLSFASATFAAEESETVQTPDQAAQASGAADAGVMTQGRNDKAQAKHKNESAKGGRPLNSDAAKVSN